MSSTAMPGRAAPSRLRCFIALGPDPATRKRLAGLALAFPEPARLHPADLHLTLAFLGTLTEDHEARLREALHPLARRQPDLSFSSLAIWPTPERPRVAVAEYALTEALRELVRSTQRILGGMALPVETRPFRPHVTLARFKPGQRTLSPPASPTAGPPARFDCLGLYCKAAPGSTVRYTNLFRFDLS